LKFNSKLRYKKKKKSRDPIEKEINDVLEDDSNEFITGLEPNANQGQEDQECAQTAAEAQRASASQAKSKRKRLVHPRKKFRIVASLMQPEPGSLQPLLLNQRKIKMLTLQCIWNLLILKIR
jgi:hypothetical protein